MDGKERWSVVPPGSSGVSRVCGSRFVTEVGPGWCDSTGDGEGEIPKLCGESGRLDHLLKRTTRGDLWRE